MGLPVVTVARGGLAVSPVASGGLPVTEAANGMGLAVTIVSGGAAGMGVTYEVLVPTITLSGVPLQNENTAIGTTIGTLSVLFPNGTYTFSKTSDPDSAFTLTGATLKNSFLWDYETKTSHAVTIQAVNGIDAPLTRTFTILVGDVDEVPPVITTATSQFVNENTVFSVDLTADKPVTWSKTGGVDQALFGLSGSTLAMIGRNYEAPADANLDNVYIVQVTATSVAYPAATTNKTITLTVANVLGPTITSSPTQTVAENSSFSLTLTANEAATWAIVGGADAGLFSLTGAVLFLSARDFEDPTHSPAYVVQVQATSLATSEASTPQTITVNVTNVADTLPAPGTPTIVWTSAATVSPPIFSFSAPSDADLIIGDTVRFQRALVTDFSTVDMGYTNAVDSTEDAANALTFSSGTWANSTWSVRARTERPGHDPSAWSNTETKTIAVVSGFDPATLGTAMVSWYKADTGVMDFISGSSVPAANGGNMIDWLDQGIQNVREESFGNPPIYNTTGFNSRPSVDFTLAAGTICTNKAAFQPTLNSATCSLFIAFKINGAAPNGPIAAFFSTGANCYNGPNTFMLQTDTDATHVGAYGNNAYIAGPGIPFTSSNHTIGLVFDGTNATLYVDGVSVGSHAWTTNIGSATHSDNGLVLGGDQLGNLATIGIAEVIMTNTAENAAAVHAYMAARLGF